MTVIFKKDGGQRHLLQWSSKSLETAPTFVSHNWKNNINR
jgi:surface antigen